MIDLGRVSIETKGPNGQYYDNPCEVSLGRSTIRYVCP
ncbi:hypothetical protein [Pedomonas mirosovicensis]